MVRTLSNELAVRPRIFTCVMDTFVLQIEVLWGKCIKSAPGPGTLGLAGDMYV